MRSTLLTGCAPTAGIESLGSASVRIFFAGSRTGPKVKDYLTDTTLDNGKRPTACRPGAMLSDRPRKRGQDLRQEIDAPLPRDWWYRQIYLASTHGKMFPSTTA